MTHTFIERGALEELDVPLCGLIKKEKNKKVKIKL